MTSDPKSEELENSVPLLSRLRPAKGATHAKKRKGRGPGSGLGKTSGKGMKGQKARHPGNFSKLAFEGGQMPLQRRLPKVGFFNHFRTDYATVNVKDLQRFDANATVSLGSLKQIGLVRRNAARVKVLGDGDLSIALHLQVQACSKSAEEKVKNAGGKVEIVPVK